MSLLLRLSMDPVLIDRIERQVIGPMTSHSLRTICLAYKDFNPDELTNWDQPVEELYLPLLTRRSSLKLLLPPKTDSLTKASQTSTLNWMKQRTFYHMEVDLNCLGIAGMRYEQNT